MILGGLIAGPLVSAQQAPPPAGPPPRTTPLRGSLERRLTTLLDQPPFDRVTWGIFVADERGRVLFQRNADRHFVPASNTKLVVATAATALLPPDFRVRTSLYVNGRVAEGVLEGDLILYGRGDPTWSRRCYAVDTLAPGVCDSAFSAIDAIADSVRARGIRRITGRIVGDGSYFEPALIHPNWRVNNTVWWFAAPVSGLAFHDNSIDFEITPGDAVDRPVTITWSPDLPLFTLENRARTGPADSGSTIGDRFLREPGTWDYRAAGRAPLGRSPWTESVAVPDPNYYAARALAAGLQRRGIAIDGGAGSTTDSLLYRGPRAEPPLVEYLSRPLGDLVFPILNSSQNTYAELLLKILGRERGGEGSWDKGLEVERRFLIDSVRLDSTAFALDDGSGLSGGNLFTPRAFVQLLEYLSRHPNRGPVLAGLPRPSQPGSLRTRFAATPIETRVAAKTGSIFRVNALSGYIEPVAGAAAGRRFTFSILANNHTVPGRQMLAQIDSIVVEIGKTK